jgi:hypothetical protein
MAAASPSVSEASSQTHATELFQDDTYGTSLLIDFAS